MINSEVGLTLVLRGSLGSVAELEEQVLRELKARYDTGVMQLKVDNFVRF